MVISSWMASSKIWELFQLGCQPAHGIDNRTVGLYPDWNVAGVAVREDMRLQFMKSLAFYLASSFTQPQSRNIAGDWQGIKPPCLLGIWSLTIAECVAAYNLRPEIEY